MRPAKYLGARTSLMGEYLLKPLEIRKPPGACADEYARETMERLCSAALEFQATMYSLPIRAEFNIHVETLALFVKIATSVARQVRACGSPLKVLLGQVPTACVCN